MAFLERAFHKLLMNFTWWVNRKDPEGRGVFTGGFLGMDNLGVFDRSRPLPTGGQLQQADGTAWMGFFCTSMLQIALELALHNRAYEDVASKFLEHFVFIADSLNNLGGRGPVGREDGFYYDQLLLGGGRSVPLKLRAMIGIIRCSLFTCWKRTSSGHTCPSFTSGWFGSWRTGRTCSAHLRHRNEGAEPHRRAAVGPAQPGRLNAPLAYLLDEQEFLSPFGVRSLSRVYKNSPYVFRAAGNGQEFPVAYVPGDMDTADFGGNSNWRGPIWLPINYLLVEALEEYHRYYGDDFRVECPTGSARALNLDEVARELSVRLGVTVPA